MADGHACAICASAREVVAYLREEADFNRSWIDGRRRSPGACSPGYVGRRTEVALQRDLWAASIEALIEEHADSIEDDGPIPGQSLAPLSALGTPLMYSEFNSRNEPEEDA